MRKLAEVYEGSHHDFKGALEGDVISVIGEFKKASPSLGKIKSKINLIDRITGIQCFCGCNLLPDGGGSL